MTNYDLMVYSSIQVFKADPTLLKPEMFGSGCMAMYRGQRFFISVSHVTNDDNLTTFLETNQPSNGITSPITPIGGLVFFDLLKVTKNTNYSDIEGLIAKGERLDITFAKIDQLQPPLLQPELDFDNLKVKAGPKHVLNLDTATMPDILKSYGFFGKVRHHYRGLHLVSTPTLRNELEFHLAKGAIYKFLAPEVINDAMDYKGCSGAPILDDEGRIVALACNVVVNTRLIYGFSIQECMKLMDVAIDTRQL